MKKKKTVKRILTDVVLFIILFGIVNIPLLAIYIPFWDLLICDFHGKIIALHLMQTIVLFVGGNIIGFSGWLFCLDVLDK